jgi:hypothetical protein
MKKPGYSFAKSKDGTFYWKTPDLPNWALPHANTNGTTHDVASQPNLQLVKDMLVGCVNESRLNTVYHRARKWPWTSTELAEINETYLNEFSRITGWTLQEHTFHDSTGLAVATMAEDLSGGISIRRSIRVPTVLAGYGGIGAGFLSFPRHHSVIPWLCEGSVWADPSRSLGMTLKSGGIIRTEPVIIRFSPRFCRP